MPLGSFAFLPEIRLCCETASNQDIRFLTNSEKRERLTTAVMENAPCIFLRAVSPFSSYLPRSYPVSSIYNVFYIMYSLCIIFYIILNVF